MASSAVVSGLDRLVEAVEAAEAAAAASLPHAHPLPSLPHPAPQDHRGFMCPHPGCHRLFSKRYNQQAHMRIHDGTRPFSCELCGKAFMWKSSLKSHAKMHAKLQLRAATAGNADASPGRVGKAGVGKRGRKKIDAKVHKPRRDVVSAVDAATLLTMFR